MPEMNDPLGAPTVVTSAQYMDALGRLGYNVENMSSSLPMMTKAANAATSLMDQQFTNRLLWDKAQADNKEAIARANQADSITDYNNKSSDLRIKQLDQENQQRDLDLQFNRYTLDGREKQFDLQQQLVKNNAEKSQATLDGDIALAKAKNEDDLNKVKQDNQDRLSAQSDLTPALAELDQLQINDPDFDSKYAAWHTRHLNAINNPATQQRIASEVGNVMAQRNSLTSVMKTAANRKEVNRLVAENHLPDNDNYDGPNGILQDPNRTQRALVQGHMSESVDAIQGLYTRLKAIGGALPAQYQQEWQDILAARDRVLGLQNPEGYAGIINGGHGDILTSDGHLRKDIQGSMADIEGYIAASAKRAAEVKPVETSVKQTNLETGRTVEYKNIPPGQENLYGRTNPEQSVAATQGVTTADVLAHPELRALIAEAQSHPTPENLAKLKAAVIAARGGKGYRYGGRVGYQTGGEVGAGSAGDPATTEASQFLSSNQPNQGGFLGTGTTDTVPALLTPGEFVLNTNAVAALGPKNLAAINKVAGATPGLTTLPGAPSSPLAPDADVAAFSALARPQDQIQHPDLIKTPELTTPVANAAPTPESNTGVQKTLSAGRLPMSNINNYAYPEGAVDLNGIDRNVWANVMSEEGPQFGMDGKHMSVFGLWQNAPGLEGQAYNTIRQYGANSLQAYKAVTSTWDKLFLQKTKPQLLTSPGMQELVIADSQHAGGGPTLKIIQQMGGWDAINKMNPKEAIATYSNLRSHLWPGNSGRVNRERDWALAHDNTLSGDTGTQVASAGMQSGGMVEGNPLYGPVTGLGFQTGGMVPNPSFNPAYNPQSAIQAMTGQPMAGQTMGYDPLQPTVDPSLIMGAPPEPDLATGQQFPPPNRPVYMQAGGVVGGGGAGGFEAELDQPGGGEGQRHRRFHPRTAGMGGGGAQPNIPDPMQKKVAKLSQDFIGGLSSLIKSKPELGGAIMQHAKNMLASTGIGDVRTGAQPEFLGGSGGGEQRQQPMGMNPAMLAMSGMGGGEGSSSEEAYT